MPRLTVLNNQPLADLAALLDGEVRLDPHNRLLYSTDASLYQVEPLGVVIPRHLADIEATVRFCARHALPILPRGGGTSLAGQCTNRAVVIDTSAGCRAIDQVQPGTGTVWTEPGVTVDELNRELARRGHALFFAPDPATSAQAAVGGCIGNNAAGGRSIRYGRTSENLAALDVLLSTGERTSLEPGAGARDPVARRLAEGALDIARRHARLIRERFPRTIRRNAGYGLDLILDQLEHGATPETADLSGLLCGSEGTLAVTLRANLRLHPLPAARGLAVISFATLEDAITAVKPFLDLGLPRGLTAVELLDDVVLDAARNNLEYRRYVDLLPGADEATGEPKAVLYVEFFGFGGPDASRAIPDAFAALRVAAQLAPGFRGLASYTDSAAMLNAWKLRKAGEPLLHGLPGPRKPVTFVEDNAVPVERLGEFVREFKKIVARHGTRAAYWAHASVGVLHVRPMIDLHDEADRARMREIALEVADLARSLGGIMSGEHGDGRVRGPLLERFFGPELMRAFRELKQLFDPRGLLNPGMIVDAGPVESITANLRALAPEESSKATEQQGSREEHGPGTFFSFDDQHGLRGAAEQCNGAGVCRKRSGGTMCPSYMATLDERHSTRGRGNALRLAITGQFAGDLGAHHNGSGAPIWDDPGTIETLNLCLSCKACKAECPSNVDIARLKAEYTAQRYRAAGKAPLSARAIGNIRFLNRLGATLPRLANWGARLSITRALLHRVLNIHPKRSLPPLQHSLYRRFAHREKQVHDEARRGRVVLFADCFTAYNEPHIGIAAVNVLEHLGYTVALLPKEGDPRYASGCCARSLISVGLLEDAIQTADETLASLRHAIEDPAIEAILVCEPSCLSAMKDDWLQLNLRTPLDIRKKLASKSHLVEDFVARTLASSPALSPQSSVPGPQVLLHAHCHQKALWGAETSAGALRALGARVTVLDSGCCGLAGSFGYAAHRHDLSMKIGELVLMPAVRAAPEATIVAPGTSCRHQIKDATGRRALHPIELIAAVMPD